MDLNYAKHEFRGLYLELVHTVTNIEYNAELYSNSTNATDPDYQKDFDCNLINVGSKVELTAPQIKKEIMKDAIKYIEIHQKIYERINNLLYYLVCFERDGQDHPKFTDDVETLISKLGLKPNNTGVYEKCIKTFFENIYVDEPTVYIKKSGIRNEKACIFPSIELQFQSSSTPFLPDYKFTLCNKKNNRWTTVFDVDNPHKDFRHITSFTKITLNKLFDLIKTFNIDPITKEIFLPQTINCIYYDSVDDKLKIKENANVTYKIINDEYYCLQNMENYPIYLPESVFNINNVGKANIVDENSDGIMLYNLTKNTNRYNILKQTVDSLQYIFSRSDSNWIIYVFLKYRDSYNILRNNATDNKNYNETLLTKLIVDIYNCNNVDCLPYAKFNTINLIITEYMNCNYIDNNGILIKYNEKKVMELHDVIQSNNFKFEKYCVNLCIIKYLLNKLVKIIMEPNILVGNGQNIILTDKTKFDTHLAIIKNNIIYIFNNVRSTLTDSDITTLVNNDFKQAKKPTFGAKAFEKRCTMINEIIAELKIEKYISC